MNHNILKKIIDRMAFNQWHNKMKKCGKEYTYIYSITSRSAIKRFGCSHYYGKFEFFYRSEETHRDHPRHNMRLYNCDICDDKTIRVLIKGPLSQNYWHQKLIKPDKN